MPGNFFNPRSWSWEQDSMSGRTRTAFQVWSICSVSRSVEDVWLSQLIVQGQNFESTHYLSLPFRLILEFEQMSEHTLPIETMHNSLSSLHESTKKTHSRGQFFKFLCSSCPSSVNNAKYQGWRPSSMQELHSVLVSSKLWPTFHTKPFTPQYSYPHGWACSSGCKKQQL